MACYAATNARPDGQVERAPSDSRPRSRQRSPNLGRLDFAKMNIKAEEHIDRSRLSVVRISGQDAVANTFGSGRE